MPCVSCGFVRLGKIAAFVLAASVAAMPAARAEAAFAVASEAARALVLAPAPSGLRAVWYGGSDDPAATLDRLERAGFRVEISLPPRLFYVRESTRRAATLPAGYSFVEAGASDAAGVASDADLFQGRDDVRPPLAPPASAGARSASRAAAMQGLPFGARWTDTSEFMIGRVAVALLFPESDGSTDPNRYDWTPALRDSVLRSAVRGLARWTSFAARRGIPLSFVIEVHAGLATRYEPISRTSGEEDLWIRDALTGLLGYKSDAGTMEYDAANGVRSRLGAQWGVLIFAVQDDSSSTGQFADGAISHARLGGPFFVTPVKNGGSAFQGASLDNYMEHEMAHMFWALDEHFPSTGWWSCSLTTGYLNIQNSNSVVPAAGYCGFPPAQCLMKGNYPDSVCVFTQGQIGWADRDLNGIPDLLETRATVFPDSAELHAVAGSTIILRGHALEFPLGNQNPYHFFAGDSISAAIVDSVVYRINGGPTTPALAADGVYDSGREYFSATLPSLPPGEYVIDWDAWNSNGLKSTNNPSTALTLSASSAPAGLGGGQPAVGAMSLRFGPTPSLGPVRFALRARPGSRGLGVVHDVQGRELARWLVTVSPSGTADWMWSGRVAGGAAAPSGLYFLSLEIDGTALKRRLVIFH
jgi:hypothetical protein